MKEPEEIWTPLKVLAWTTGYLSEKGIENARREAEWLLCAATALDRMGLYLNFDRPLHDHELTVYRSMVARRGKREPLQHILGTQEFDGLEFMVSPAALIPRHDTEVLVATACAQASSAATVLDIGTGSGCVAVALARRLPRAAVTAIDLSPDALALARRNAEQHQVAIEFLLGSFFQPVADRCFDLIVSNPPYIPTRDLATLEPEVRDFDPRLALDGGPDGLDAYRSLVSAAPHYLAPGGWLLLEVGAGQDAAVAELCAAAGFGAILTVPDGAGIQRVVGGVWHG
ncbi:MAG: peptide chain release factor N(5)-glutamine methyltransferase [Geobacter sp.]|nr:peptide chain release factor N(5)-glutamine methyltransferase [Geobacter sp.]